MAYNMIISELKQIADKKKLQLDQLDKQEEQKKEELEVVKEEEKPKQEQLKVIQEPEKQKIKTIDTEEPKIVINNTFKSSDINTEFKLAETQMMDMKKQLGSLEDMGYESFSTSLAFSNLSLSNESAGSFSMDDFFKPLTS
jgi:hypothetical protein